MFTTDLKTIKESFTQKRTAKNNQFNYYWC